MAKISGNAYTANPDGEKLFLFSKGFDSENDESYDSKQEKAGNVNRDHDQKLYKLDADVEYTPNNAMRHSACLIIVYFFHGIICFFTYRSQLVKNAVFPIIEKLIFNHNFFIHYAQFYIPPKI